MKYIFDMDGTLYSLGGTYLTSPLFIEIHSRIDSFIQKQLGLNSTEVSLEKERLMNIYGEHLSIALEKEHGIDRMLFFNTLWDVEVEKFVPKNPALKELFSRLNGNVAILTNAPRIWADKVLKHLEIFDLVNPLIFTGEGDVRKPNPQQFIQVCQALDVEAKNVCSIGDQEESDIIPAKKLGMKTVIVGKSNHADFEIDSIADFEKLLKDDSLKSNPESDLKSDEDQLIKLTQDLIKINSVTGNEKEILLFIECILSNNEINFQRIKVSENRWNIFATKGSGNNGILFSGHCDTVPFSNKWVRNPFGATIEEDRIFGLGASDMKSGLASIIQAFISTESSSLNGLLITVGEESGTFDVMRSAVSSGLLSVFNQSIISDTSSLDVIIEQSGLFNIEITISGMARHSRSFYNGTNPIHDAAKLISRLVADFERYNNPEKTSKFGNKPILTVNKIEGGIANNVIPPEITFFIDRRISPLENIKEVESFFSEKLLGYSNVVWKIKGKVPSVDNSNSKIAQNIIESSEKKLNLATSNGVSEIVFLVEKGIDAIFFGPGDKDKAHTSDESCSINNIISHNVIMRKLMARNN